MDLEHYRRRLEKLEQELLNPLTRESATAREASHAVADRRTGLSRSKKTRTIDSGHGPLRGGCDAAVSVSGDACDWMEHGAAVGRPGAGTKQRWERRGAPPARPAAGQGRH